MTRITKQNIKAKPYRFVMDDKEVLAASFVFDLSPEQIEVYKNNASMVTSKLLRSWKDI